jgi:hypothetical protein
MFVARREQAQWKTIFDYLVTMRIGDVVTYKKLEELLPDVPVTSVRPAFYQAQKAMQDAKLRTFVVVRGEGYRMVEANEHEGLARGKHKSAKRLVAKAQRIAASADRSRLTADERRRIDALEHHLAAHADMLKRLDARQDRIEQRVAFTEKDSVQLADRLEAIEKLLEQKGLAS